jgi:two-component system, NarL family, invasion response regulator UvrY
MKILIADDHAVLRKGLVQILAEEYPDAHFGETSTTPETLDCLSQHRWDLLVLDIFMPGRTGLEVLHEVRQQYANLPVLVLSSAPEEQLAVRVLKAGASGYLNKQTAPENLVEACRRILAGGRYVSAALAEQLATELSRRDLSPPDKLSDREFAVLQLLLTGKTIKEIAGELSLSAKTVSTYHLRIWEKFHARNDVELVRYALEHRLGDEGQG